MRSYSTIAPTFWTGETGRRIRKIGPEAQVLALYLLTNPHANAFGLYYLPLVIIEHETGLSAKRIAAILRELETDFCRYDTDAEFIWVIEMAGYQIGELKSEDRRLISVRRNWDQMPPNPFTGAFYDKYGARYGLNRRASKGHAKGIRTEIKPMPSPQICDPEQEQDQEGCSELGVAASEPAEPLTDFVFETVGREKTWTLPTRTLQKLTLAFPGVDIPAELLKAIGWCHANARKRKTDRGMPEFLFRWIEKAQNSGGRRTASQETSQRREEVVT
ncbi:MAG TPA: hypothetical protein VFN81_06685 [Sphingomicrobium sp.]|nr:hypothetical protein [Sphingomicrobium sp.]